MTLFKISAFNAVGGYQELIRKYMDESEPSENATLIDRITNETCGTVPRNAMYELHLQIMKYSLIFC